MGGREEEWKEEEWKEEWKDEEVVAMVVVAMAAERVAEMEAATEMVERRCCVPCIRWRWPSPTPRRARCPRRCGDTR